MKPYTIIFSLLLSLLTITPATATSLLPITLEQLSTRANLIFYGEVINNQVKVDEQSGRIVTYTEFKIIELIKDNSGQISNNDNHTIKQLGGRLESSHTHLRVHGVPQYLSGNKYVVFLPEKSSLGFCSPLGLHQGSFSVTTINGEQVISNGHQLAQQSSNIIIPAQTLNNSSAKIPLAVNNDNPTQAYLYDFINNIRSFISH